jgi:hypothetical protein
MALYAVTDGETTLLDTIQIPDAIPAGHSTDSLLFSTTADQLGKSLLIRIDDDGTGTGIQNECDESNNRELFTDIPC